MFPCSKVFHLNGKPTFNVPEGKQVAFGRQLEKIVKAQRFTFKETCLLPPARTVGDRNFEYRILLTLDPHGEHYAIRFKYFESGRPKKTTHGAEHYTQKAFAAMLNTACNCKSFTVNVIHDWEHGRSEIPFAWIDGASGQVAAAIRDQGQLKYGK